MVKIEPNEYADGNNSNTYQKETWWTMWLEQTIGRGSDASDTCFTKI
jgi:hypothetical protein